MAISARLQSLLTVENAAYSMRRHDPAFTAQEVAAQSHVPGRDLAKVVVARTPEGSYVMAVLPALCRVDLVALAKSANVKSLTLAHEAEILRLFPDCEPGAMPPFGRLYGLPLFVDACFPHYETLYFQAGNHRELVGMPFHEFERLAAPIMGEFCLHGRRGG